MGSKLYDDYRKAKYVGGFGWDEEAMIFVAANPRVTAEQVADGIEKDLHDTGVALRNLADYGILMRDESDRFTWKG